MGVFCTEIQSRDVLSFPKTRPKSKPVENYPSEVPKMVYLDARCPNLTYSAVFRVEENAFFRHLFGDFGSTSKVQKQIVCLVSVLYQWLSC